MRSRLRAYYLDQMMRPGFLGVLVNPFFFARAGLFDAVRRLAKEIHGKVLDVGCGNRPYQLLFGAREYIGLELDTPENRRLGKADKYYDGRTFPFETDSFDSVLCNQVLEHVFEPDAFVVEIARVLKPGGSLLLTVPFVWDEHEQPRDYGRYSSFGLKALLERHGFEILVSRKTVGDFRAILQVANAYIYKVTRTANVYINLLITMILIAPINIVGALVWWFLPRNPDFYLDNVVLARKASRK